MDNRTQRLKLGMRNKPYWVPIEEGGHLGYYRGARVTKWLARYREPGSELDYQQETIGQADDYSDANEDTILSWGQAQNKARQWFELLRRNGGRRPVATKTGMHVDRLKSHGGRSRGYTVSDALDDYLEGFTGKSLYATRSRCDAIIRPELGRHMVAKLTAKQIGDWHRTRAKSPARLRTAKNADKINTRSIDNEDAVRRRRSTANRDLTVLKAALNRAYQNGSVASDDAWRRVRPFGSVDSAKTRCLSDEEVRRFVNACDPEFKPVVQGMLLTGARYGELCKAKVADFDEAAATLRFVTATTKSKKTRYAYLDPEGTKLLCQLTAGKISDQLIFVRADGGPWKPSSQNRRIESACERGKIEPRATCHDTRRTYGARLAMRGVPLQIIAHALGHADTRTCEKHYAHLLKSHVSETIRKNVAGLGIVEDSNVVTVNTAR